MSARYEYTFVRLGEGWLGFKRKQTADYQGIIEQYAQEGWRLVQIFAPGTGVYGCAAYFELIFERELPA